MFSQSGSYNNQGMLSNLNGQQQYQDYQGGGYPNYDNNYNQQQQGYQSLLHRSNSRPDSAYSKDTNTMKSQLHGKKYGYYSNEPYSYVGSSLSGSRFYKDHPELSNAAPGSLHGKQSRKVPQFEDNLLRDPRTGQKIGNRSVNPVISTIMKESSNVRKNQALQEGIMKLKESGSLTVPHERIRSTDDSAAKRLRQLKAIGRVSKQPNLPPADQAYA